jgi:hypothetical protein
MLRPQQLFAISAAVTLSFGLLSPLLFPTLRLSLPLQNTYYVFPFSTACTVVAMFFCLFSAVYSFWILPINQTAAAWHFWMTAVGALLFCSILWHLGQLAHNGGATSSLGAAQAWTLIAAFVVAVAAQAIFIVNITAAVINFRTG